MADFIAQRGAFAMFVTRLIPGIRLMADSRAGYAIGYDLSEYVERLQKLVVGASVRLNVYREG